MEEKAHKRRSGTETRKRRDRISFRVAEAERTELEGKAGLIGVTMGSFIRTSLLDKPVTQTIRRPAVEVQEITRLQGELNKIGSNIHQLLRRVNFGETPVAEEFTEALSGYREAIDAILTALGRGAGRV
jgi:hypothetical protein